MLSTYESVRILNMNIPCFLSKHSTHSHSVWLMQGCSRGEVLYFSRFNLLIIRPASQKARSQNILVRSKVMKWAGVGLKRTILARRCLQYNTTSFLHGSRQVHPVFIPTIASSYNVQNGGNVAVNLVSNPFLIGSTPSLPSSNPFLASSIQFSQHIQLRCNSFLRSS